MKTTLCERLDGTGKLCRRLGISRNHLWMVRKGMRKPSPRLAARLRRLGVLVPGTDTKKEGAE